MSTLKKAIGSFKHLQHVRVLPVADQEQQILLRLIRQDPTLKRLVDLNWTEACYHCSRTVGQALKVAKLPPIRFSYPKLSPQDARLFSQRKLQSISRVAATLTSLTLQFEEVENMDQEIRDLSPLFRQVFRQAENMEAIHVGFLSPQPLSLPLEGVFQHVRWKKVSCIHNRLESTLTSLITGISSSRLAYTAGTCTPMKSLVLRCVIRID